MTDGNITAAKKRLQHAIDDLIRPRPGIIRGHTRYQPSLYDALVSEAGGTQGDTRTPAKSLPPLWIDAVQLRTDIDRQVTRWHPKPGTTVFRLAALSDRGWRPQDTDQVNTITHKISGWCDHITTLLDPDKTVPIPEACPSCDKRLVYRRDSAGEMVRQPALRIVVGQGCTCGACGAFWAPEKFVFLARLLGHDLPEGVLE